MIQDLLDLSALVSGHLQLDLGAVVVAQIVPIVLEELAPGIAEKTLAVECLVDPGAVVRADAARVRQILAKILANAVKFTPAHGRITVAVERGTDLVEIRVADTGVGITPEFLARVFDAFRQADDSTTRRHKGLGLGLAIVRHLVRLHGGTVAVSSDGPDRGTLLTVRLPAADAATAGPEKTG